MKRRTSVRSRFRSLQARAALGAPLTLALAGALAACADPEPRELGFTQSAQDLRVEPTEPFFEPSSEFIGRWVGTAVEPLALSGGSSPPTYRFPSGSSQFVLDLRLENANLIGTLTFGEGEPLPEATDPDVGYPEGVAYDALFGYERQEQFEDSTAINFYIQTSQIIPPFEGFPYRVELTTGLGINSEPPLVPDGVLSLRFTSYEPLERWCFLQTPFPSEFPSGYFCIPSTGGGLEFGSDGTGQSCKLWGPPILDGCLPDFSNIGECYEQGEVVAELNCDKVTMCAMSVCTCYDAGCTASETDERLAVRRDGDELVALFERTVFKNARGLSTPLGEVRFRRVE